MCSFLPVKILWTCSWHPFMPLWSSLFWSGHTVLFTNWSKRFRRKRYCRALKISTWTKFSVRCWSCFILFILLCSQIQFLCSQQSPCFLYPLWLSAPQSFWKSIRKRRFCQINASSISWNNIVCIQSIILFPTKRETDPSLVVGYRIFRLVKSNSFRSV